MISCSCVKVNRDPGFVFKYLQLTTVGYLRRRRIFRLAFIHTKGPAQKKPGSQRASNGRIIM